MRRVDQLKEHLAFECNGEIDRVDPVLENSPTAGIRMGGAVDVEEIKRRVSSWKKFLFEFVPKKIAMIESQQRMRPCAADLAWAQQEYDVVVIGYGGAGAAAALDAADADKKVLLVDRFDGGGSTRRSGGVYYAGGGTRAQNDLGIADDVDNMFNYVKYENGGVVDDATIRAFCEQSPGTFAWLEDRVGIPFKNEKGKRVYYKRKTSYPPSSTTLYHSGNEAAAPYNTIATPAPRGNRPFGDYLVGNMFFGGFEKAVESHPNITVQFHTRVVDVTLSTDNSKCVGVQLQCLPDMDEWADVQGMHVMLHEIGSGSPIFDPQRKMDTQCLSLEAQLMDKFSAPVEVAVKGGVILATGGFFFNQSMVAKHASSHTGFMPLGNLGDDGSGMAVAQRAGASLSHMDRLSAWKFINPPFSFMRGVLTNARGERVGNEDVYGASFADFLIQKHGGKGWLVIDQKMWDDANRDCLDPESGLQEDQRMQGLTNLYRNCKKGDTWPQLAQNAGIDPDTLQATMKQYNADAAGKTDTVFGKMQAYLMPLVEGPFYAINLDMTGNKFWPTPCMSLGGVKVEGASGQVISQASGQPIQGLYAAGRTAVGIASNYYVSGLSLADCVFSGRRAGQHAASRC